jgi:arylsulfatase A-like enzyme
LSLVASLAASLAVSGLLVCAPARPRPNVVFVLVDTLRQDFLHVYGHPEPLSPAIDALAARGTLFENHLSHAPQTVPATLSLLTSQLPAEHGFLPDLPGGPVKERWVYPSDVVFVQEALRDAGYATAGFTANPFVTAANGFDQGFDRFADRAKSGAELNAAALAWLRKDRPRERPFFLYLHYMDVHQPYDPPTEQRERFVHGKGIQLQGNRVVGFYHEGDMVHTRELYTACVAHQDQLVGEILAALEAEGLSGETLVVLTADHGEEFGEHGGIGHGTSLYGELVRVPLLIARPDGADAGRRVAHASQHIDVSPTLLALAGVDAPASFRGGSLSEPAVEIFLEMGSWLGVVAEGAKLVRKSDTGEQRLFALADRLDATPLDDVALAERLGARLDAYASLRRDPRIGPSGPALTDAERERLRALGYAE